MMKDYTFVVSRARRLTSCPTVHLISCQHAKRIKPIREFTVRGVNAVDALATYNKRWRGTFNVPPEPGKCCLKEAS